MRKKVQVWIHHQGKVLLLKTIKERGAFWQPVTGSVEEGETLSQGALREAREETGFSFDHPPRSLGFEFTFKSKWGEVQEHAFDLELDAEEAQVFQVKVDPKEHTEAKWVSPSEAFTLLKFDSNEKALQLLIALLNQRKE